MKVTTIKKKKKKKNSEVLFYGKLDMIYFN